MDYLLFDMLFEGRLEDVRKNLSGIALDAFNETISLEPKLSDKYYKYLEKIYRHQSSLSPRKIHNLLVKFDNAVKKNYPLPSRDIYSKIYENIEDLEREIDKLVDHKSKEEIEKENKEKGTNIIYSDQRYLVIQPTTTESACYYGKDTKWCVSAKEENQFQSYTNSGIKLVFIIDKNLAKQDPYAKTAIAFLGNNTEDTPLIDKYEVYDSKDSFMTIEDVHRIFPSSLLEKINYYFKQQVVSTTKEEEMERIQALPSKDVVYQILLYLQTMEGEIQEDVEGRPTADPKRMAYFTYSIKKLLNNLSQEQKSYVYQKLYNLTIGFQINNDSKLFLRNLLIEHLEKQINSSSDSSTRINNMIYNFGLAPKALVDLGISLNLPTDPKESVRLLENTLDENLKNILLEQNRRLLAKEVFRNSKITGIYIAASTFRMGKETIDAIHKKFPDYSLGMLDEKFQSTVKRTFNTSTMVEPEIDWLDWQNKEAASNLYLMFINDELEIVTHRLFGPMVFFIPKFKGMYENKIKLSDLIF